MANACLTHRVRMNEVVVHACGAAIPRAVALAVEIGDCCRTDREVVTFSVPVTDKTIGKEKEVKEG